MDYESSYEKLLFPHIRAREVAEYTSEDTRRAKATDADIQDSSLSLPLMAPIFWKLAFIGNDGYIPSQSAFVETFTALAMDNVKSQFRELVYCLGYGIAKSPQDYTTNTTAMNKELEEHFRARARRSFFSFCRDLAMIVMLGSPKYGKNKIIYSSELDMKFKLDTVIILEDGTVCGLGYHYESSNSVDMYEKHLRDLHKNKRSHGNLKVVEVGIGSVWSVGGHRGVNDPIPFHRHKIWFPPVKCVDAAFETILGAKRPLLSDIRDDNYTSPKEEIEKALKTQETRWPNFVWHALRALT